LEECEVEIKKIELHHVTVHKQAIDFGKFNG
jgi:hypothetical protein